MSTEVAKARPLRPDARRNRDALLVAAAAQFAEGGVEAPRADTARVAGAGSGTRHRPIPTTAAPSGDGARLPRRCRDRSAP